MNVQELRQLLKPFPSDALVIVARDSEGNGVRRQRTQCQEAEPPLIMQVQGHCWSGRQERVVEVSISV